MKLLLLLIVVVSANAATLGTRKCSYGPTYWCGSISQAKECGAVQYCTDNDWANIRTKDSAFCTDCKLGVDALREELSKASTEDEIEKVIEGFCSKLGALAEDCKLVVEAYGSEVLKALIERLNPEQICALMGFCKANTTVRSPNQDMSPQVASLLMTQARSGLMDILQNQMPADPNDCSDCTVFFGDVKDKLNDPAVEKEITDELKMLCQYLGAYKTECELIVTTLVPQGIGDLVQELVPKQVCSEIGFCQSSLMDVPIPEPPPNDPCDDCKRFMGDVKRVLSNATVQQMIIKKLEMYCNDLGSLAPQCQQYVDQYGKLVLSVLVQEFDPASVCGVLTFCNASDAPVRVVSADGCPACELAVRAFETLLSNSEFQADILNEVGRICPVLGRNQGRCRELITEYGPLLISLVLDVMDPSVFCSQVGLCAVMRDPHALPEPGDICTDCENFVNDFDNLLNNYTVQQKYLKDLTIVCKYFPNYADQCNMYIMEYGGLVFEVIAGFINPRTVCTDLGLCQGERRQPLKMPEATLKLIQSLAPSNACAECKAVFQDLQKLFSDPAVQQMVEQELELICNDLGPLGPLCKQYVSEYADMVFNFLIQYIDPDALCSLIGLCQSGMSQPDLPPRINGDDCSDCKNFFKDVSTILNTPSVQQSILMELETLCNGLGPNIGPQCQQYVSEYGPLVVNFLLQYLDPTTVCGGIGFCPSESASQPLAFVALKTVLKTPTVSGDLCTDCKALVNDADGLLKNATVQKMFLKDLSGLCKYFGGLNSECQDIIMEYGPLVFEYLAAYIDPATICEDIGLCPVALKQSNDDCTDCKNFFQDVATMLNTPSVQQMIIQELENFCNVLGPNIGPQCVQYVSEYGQMVIDFMLQYLDPTAICGDMKFCPALSPLKVVRLNADDCTDCKAFFKDVSAMLNDPTVQQNILQGLEGFCNDLGPNIGPQCQQYVSEYGPLVVNYLLQYLDPASVCGDIGFCPAMTRPPMNLVKLNADDCTDCKAFLKDVSVMLNDPTVQKQVLQGLEGFCNDLGPNISPQCQQYVSEYGPLVINYLLQYLEPASICADIGFCSALTQPPVTLVKKNSDDCTDCKNFFQDVQNDLKNATVQHIILQAIGSFCDALGPSLSQQCQQYVSTYGPLVLNMLAQNLDPATVCGDIGFCSAVTRSPLKMNADNCTDCKNFFKDVVKVLNDPANQQTILQFLENACNDLGPSLGPQCQQYVSEYGPLAFNFLLQYLDPATICGEIGFCSAQERTVNSDDCTDCKNFFQDVQNDLKNATVQHIILQAIGSLCDDLGPSLSQQCQQYVLTYGPLVLNMLAQYLDPATVCGDIGFCPAVTRSPLKMNGDNCTDCKNFFKDVVKVLNDPANQQIILQFLENACNDLGPSLGPQCQQYVSEYGPLAFNFLLQYLDPATVCGEIGFCSAQERTLNADDCTDCKNFLKDVVSVLNDPSNQQIILGFLENACNDLGPNLGPQCQQYVSEYGSLAFNFLLQYLDPATVCGEIGFCSAQLPKELKVNADECTDCKNFFKDVVRVLNDPTNQQIILQFLENACNDLGPNLGPQCQQYVSEYGSLAFNFLLQYLDPATVCGEIGFCSAQLPKELKVNADDCTDCKNFFKDVVRVLNDPTNQQIILKFLENACNDLGPNLGPQCQQYVSEYGSLAFNFLLQYLDPATVCGDIGFCSAQVLQERNVNADDCTDCKNFFKDAVKMLNAPSTQQTILGFLENACNDLGPNLAPQCQQYVSEYGPLAFNFLLQYLDPVTVCGEIGFCSAQLLQERNVNADDCTDCKNFFKDVSNVLNQPANQQIILQYLGNLCNDLGPNIGPQCQQYVSEYGPLVFNYLLQYLDPTSVCNDIGFCPTMRTVAAIELTAARPVRPLKARTSESVHENSAVTCELCELLVKHIDLFLQQNSTEEEIVAALEEVCNILPSSIADECNGLLEQYGTVLIQLIVSEMDPDKVCSLIQLCSSKEDLTASTECTLCEYALTELDKLITKDSSIDEIKAALEEVCTLLPSTLTAECETFVETYTETIVNLIVQNVPPQLICRALGLCKTEAAAPVPEAGPECTICEFVMEKLDSLISKDSTEKEIEAALDEVCSLLPSTVRVECQTFVNTYTPQIIELLLQELSPQMICKTLGLCSSESIKAELEAGPECTVCEYIMEKLDTLISKDSTEEEIEAALDKVCSLLPSSVTEECKTLVNTYTPTIINLLLQEVSPQLICRALGLCTSKTDVEFGPVCALCKMVMGKVEDMIDSEASVAEIEAALEEVCSLLPSKYATECQELVDEYTSRIVDLLTQSVPPGIICRALGLCVLQESVEQDVEFGPVCALCKMVLGKVEDMIDSEASVAEIEAALEEVCSLLPSKYATECQELVDEYTSRIIDLLTQSVPPGIICRVLGLCVLQESPLQDNESGPVCTMCKLVMDELENMIGSQSTVAEIEAALDKVCSFLPSKYATKCQNFVDEYTQQIVDLLTQSVSPGMICKLLNLCVLEDSPVQDNESGPVCTMCKLVMDELESMIGSQSTVAEIEAALDKVCSFLPSKYATKCQNFVDEYTQQIVNLLTQSVSPGMICKLLNLCVLEDSPVQDNESGPVCTMCKLVMDELESMIGSQSTVAEIEAALDKVCSFLPSKYATKCQNFVDEYTQQIVNLLTQSVSPGMICKLLDLCVLEDSPVQVTKPGPECVLCEYILTEVDKLLVKESTISDIRAALDKVCGLLPGTLTAQCQNFVDIYTETIVNLLVQNVPPQLICRAISLCKAAEPQVQEREPEAESFCAVCEFAMSEFEKLLVEPASEARIEELLNMVCSKLPTTVSETCESFVTQYTREIIFLITQSVTPKQICSALTLCTSARAVEDVPDVPAPKMTDVEDVDASTECVVCEFAMRELEKQLGKNATEEEIQQALGEVCNLLPESIREDCNILVTYYTTEVIYQFIRKYPANKICQLLGVCAVVNGELKSVAHVQSIEAGPECAICEFVAKELEGMLQKDSTEKAIRQALEEVCDLLPGTVKENCVEFVDYYTEEIIFILISQFPPDKICSTIQLCTAVQENTELKKVGADENTPQCAVCEFVATYLEKELQNNATEEEIRAALESVCSKLPSTVNRECNDFVEYYTEEIIFILMSQFPPEKLCTLLNLCTATDLPEATDVGVTCEICIIAVRNAELYITKNTTEAEIEKVLDALCKTFPGGLQEQCLSLVGAFGNVLPELIVALGDADKVCQVINLCPRQTDIKQLAFEQCKSGPEFWCASQSNADLCNAVEHCKRHVWN